MTSKMFSHFLCFASGLIVMLVFCAWRVGDLPSVVEKKQNDAIIQACEQELPRNKHCVLMAVPEEALEIIE